MKNMKVDILHKWPVSICGDATVLVNFKERQQIVHVMDGGCNTV